MQMAVGLSGHWGCISVTQIRRKCLKWNYYCTWIFFRTSITGSSHFKLGLTVNQNQKRDYIRKQLWKDTSSIYKKTMHFLQLATKLQRWTAREGLYLPKKIGIYQALSLSLSLSSTGRESERRGRGELDPDRVQPPNCHFWPTCAVPSRAEGVPCHFWPHYFRPYLYVIDIFILLYFRFI